MPCSAPPWSTLAAIDLESGDIMWQVPFGSIEGTVPWPLYEFFDSGAQMGGPTVTAGGLIFIGASMDGYFHAYDVDTGEIQWSHSIEGRYESTMAGIGPRSTPTISGGIVYTQGAGGRLLALDGATGEVLWEKDLLAEFGMIDTHRFLDGAVIQRFFRYAAGKFLRQQAEVAQFTRRHDF